MPSIDPALHACLSPAKGIREKDKQGPTESSLSFSRPHPFKRGKRKVPENSKGQGQKAKNQQNGGKLTWKLILAVLENADPSRTDDEKGRQGGKGNVEGVEGEGLRYFSFDEGVASPGGSAARAIEPGELLEETRRKKTMNGGIE